MKWKLEIEHSDNYSEMLTFNTKVEVILEYHWFKRHRPEKKVKILLDLTGEFDK